MRLSGLLSAPWSRARLAIGTRPISDQWGFDRGRPVHRHYVARFLEHYASDIRGDCLEFQEGDYCDAFGGDRVARLDVLHLDASNPHATIVADITRPDALAGRQFDCIVCSHVLHIIYDLESAIGTMFSALKPGGVLLVAVPGISMCDPHYGELWRFTGEGLRRLLTRSFGEEVTVHSYGNSLAAAAELRGVVAGELLPFELEAHDERFAVEVCARAVRRLDSAKPNEKRGGRWE